MIRELQEKIDTNVSAVRERISDAAKRSGRTPESVKLIAVSKYAQKDDGIIEALLNAGCRDLGESRPQMLIEKAEAFASSPFASSTSEIHWHLIGTLQRNKIRKVLPFVSLMHSLDSVRLIEAIDRIIAEESLPPVTGLLEINISGDATKQGFAPGDFPAVLEEIAEFSNVKIRGLMCMSGLTSENHERRAEFAAAGKLWESLIPHCPDNCRMEELSMGMSDDFELAINEGATMVRLGSSLFENILF
ncbi:MAG: YggS family pyridoxal phosphate-dependent enzyme [Planctomycetaceae bacterium]|nr:YggS family pyridoxal phosphate-dependent enzyme [Planctomycetaceae bacterium]